MATKKKPQPKTKPPKNTRMDIILDPERQEVLKKLEEITGMKANTKILFHCASYYLHDRTAHVNRITSQQKEIQELQGKLRTLNSAVSQFLNGFEVLKQFQDGAPSFTNSDVDDDTKEAFCPECGEECYENVNDKFYCPECDMEF